MQRISETLKDKLPPVDYRDPEYIERVLIGLAPTADVEQSLAKLVAERDTHVEGSSVWLKFNDRIETTQTTIERCKQRDEIKATRPDGCWCLGVGGRYRRYTADGGSLLSHTCGCPEGLEALAHAERIYAELRIVQQASRAKALFGASQVPARFRDCTLANYPVTKASRPGYEALKYWVIGPPDDADDDSWAEYAAKRKKSVLIHGPYGVGKTSLAVALLREEVEIEGGGLFFTVPQLLDHIRATYAPNPVADEREVINRIKTAPFLVLDDLGAERVTDWVREKLFTIINYRHDEDLPTVFTSNLDVAELGEHIGQRIVWRIVEMCEVVKLDGPNLRDRKAV